MLFVFRMAFSAFFFPVCFLYFREKDIGGLLVIVYFRQIKSVGKCHSFAVDAGASDNEYFLFFPAGVQCFLQAAETLCSFKCLFLRCQYNVPAVWQRTFGKRFKCFSSHDDGVSGCQCLETFQIVGQPVKQLVPEAQAAVPVDCCNDGYVMSFLFLNGYFSGNVRPGIIVIELEVFVSETENVLYVWVQFHGRERAGSAGQLQIDLLQVV